MTDIRKGRLEHCANIGLFILVVFSTLSQITTFQPCEILSCQQFTVLPNVAPLRFHRNGGMSHLSLTS
jgi:hypothetical protein